MISSTDAFLELILVFMGILFFMGYGFLAKKTDWSGSVSGGVIASVIYLGIGIPGLLYFLVFFIVGSQASKWKYRQKALIGLAQENHARRTYVHAFSNAGAAALTGILALFGFNSELAHIAIACVFAAATSDTLSSEIGNIVGKQFYQILDFKPGKRGEDGVVSPEGSFAGVAGSLVIALLYLIFTFDAIGFVIVFFMGIGANIVDSFLGATLQKKHFLNNHTVNLISTLIAGIGGILLYAIAYLLVMLFN